MIKIKRHLETHIIVRASFWVALITLATKVLGYSEKIIVANLWGTSFQADVYNAVFSILIGITVFFREVFEPGLLNTSIQARKNEGEPASGRVFISMFYFIGLIALLLCLFIYCWPEAASKLFLSGFQEEQSRLTASFFRIGSLGLFFLIVTNVSNTWLLSNKAFVTISLSDFFFKAAILATALLLSGSLGIHSLIYGFLFGAMIKFGIQAVRIRQTSGRIQTKPDFSFVRVILLVSWPLLIGNFFSFLGNIADHTFASYLSEGTISSLNYAKKIIDLPVILFPYTLSMIVFPFFSELSVEKDTVRLHGLLNNSIKYILLFFIPLMLLIGLFAPEIIRIIYEHGSFGSDSTEITSRALSVYNIGLIGFALETILVIFLFSQGRIKMAVGMGIISVILDILITALLIRPLGYLAIATGLVVSKWIKVILLCMIIRMDWKKIITMMKGIKTLIGLLLFSILPIVVKVVGLPGSGRFVLLLELGAVFFLSYAAYGLWLYRTHVIDLRHGGKK